MKHAYILFDDQQLLFICGKLSLLLFPLCAQDLVAGLSRSEPLVGLNFGLKHTKTDRSGGDGVKQRMNNTSKMQQVQVRDCRTHPSSLTPARDANKKLQDEIIAERYL